MCTKPFKCCYLTGIFVIVLINILSKYFAFLMFWLVKIIRIYPEQVCYTSWCFDFIPDYFILFFCLFLLFNYSCPHFPPLLSPALPTLTSHIQSFLLLNIIRWYGCTLVCSTIHPFKEIWIDSYFWIL